VGVVFVGYPKGIAQERVGKGGTSMWGYRRLLTRLLVTLENHGIAAFAVAENGASSTCTRHSCEETRKPRGLIHCPRGCVAHADVNAAPNILMRGVRLLECEAKPPKRVKVYSFLLTPSGVIEEG